MNVNAPYTPALMESYTPTLMDKLIYTAIRHARFWMRKAGISAKARRALWLDLAESERGFSSGKKD